MWLCRCDCGRSIRIMIGNLSRGNSRSCGCLKSELSAIRMTTHGMSRLPENKIWKDMKLRCLNPKYRSYPRYGGRGITICARWLNDFSAFFADMGPRPSRNHTIERTDNNGNYEPENCIWDTRKRQARNKSSTRYITVCGKELCMADVAEQFGIPYGRLKARLDIGWPIERAITAAKWG